ncbi:putative GPI anchored protein [Pyronema omphalodes]|nr:putative GPI anchored protein [Pyronema omphalodes]
MQFSKLLTLAVVATANTLAMTINLDLDLSAVSHGLQHDKKNAAPLKISHVPGFFKQDDPLTDDKKFDYITENFGLVAKSWSDFEEQIEQLNHESGEDVSYRVLYLARHGQGWHNVAESYYGTPAWDAYWSKLDGNGTITWDDAKLTDQGVAEAQKANAAFKKGIKEHMPRPEGYYSSPLSRAASTLEITWSDISLDHRNTKAIIKEGLRETIGVHTCDRRGTKTYLKQTYKKFLTERGFAEKDPLWTADVRESNPDRNIRLQAALQDIFRSDGSTYISITAHGGAIQSILEVIGHRAFSLQTGGVIPVVVKVEGEQWQNLELFRHF